MPSYEDFQELKANCTAFWVTIDGVNACKFVSNVNGKEVLFPAHGRMGSGGLDNDNLQGWYWSTYYGGESSARGLITDSTLTNAVTGHSRSLGCLIRPVRDP